MTKEATPPPTATTHQPPSLPNSPLAKRPKTTTMVPVTEPVAAPAQSESTPTPSTTPRRHLPFPIHRAPSPDQEASSHSSCSHSRFSLCSGI
ncbi:dUTPase [Histoplasma ohiense]|nr:dUTPase [Histoplasma ohiense (nom. inval.)]